jgi:hypothetical protein
MRGTAKYSSKPSSDYEEDDEDTIKQVGLFGVMTLVTQVSGGIPTLADARIEAQRQARKNPGVRYYITGPLEEVIAKEIPVEIKPYEAPVETDPLAAAKAS